MITKRYNTILIDPPWSFKVWSKDTGSGRSAESHYDTMDIDDLKSLQIQNMMSEDCAVFMWAVWPLLPEAFDLAAAWGLSYKTCAFNWIKLNKLQSDKPFMGMGYWTRGNSEPCLLFTKGKPKRQSRGVSQILLDWEGGLFPTETIATPIRSHSEKPVAIYERIESLVAGDYAEVFARNTRPGWDSFGNVIDERDIRDVLSGFCDG